MNAAADREDHAVMIDRIRHASDELDLLRQRRELLFWTITMTLALIILTALTMAFLFSLIKDNSPDGTYTAAAGVGSATLVRIIRRERALRSESGRRNIRLSKDP
jgi:hypothetical protein